MTGSERMKYPHKKLLFLIKQREFTPTKSEGCGDGYSEVPYSKTLSSGLYNSVRFIVDMLNKHQVCEAVLETCIDNNCIDRLVTKHRPTHVILEALWVVPSKLDVLMPLHPKVKWVLRLHSEVPFIANEGIALEWMHEYTRKGAIVTANSLRMVDAAELILHLEVPYSPNYYPLSPYKSWNFPGNYGCLDIGCFGAVRPLKNHLIQAKAAIAYADKVGKKLRFHINATRVEGNGSPVLKNLRALFRYCEHELVEHDWLDHERFLDLLSTLDCVMQVSFTETFNIVSADAVSVGCPVVTSREIPFVACVFLADPTNIRDIMKKLERAINWSDMSLHNINRYILKKNGQAAVKQWTKLIKEI